MRLANEPGNRPLDPVVGIPTVAPGPLPGEDRSAQSKPVEIACIVVCPAPTVRLAADNSQLAHAIASDLLLGAVLGARGV